MSSIKRSAVIATATKVFAIISVLLAAPVAKATLVGTSVGGQLNGLGNAMVGMPFSSPSLVGEGPVPEFSGTVNDANQNALAVSVDLFAESFVIEAFFDGQWGTQVGDGFSVLLTDLFWSGSSGEITNVELTRTLGDTEKWDLTFANLITFDADFIEIQLLLTQAASGRAVFEFGITADHQGGGVTVPEPATAALLFLGLLGAGFKRRTAL